MFTRVENIYTPIHSYGAPPIYRARVCACVYVTYEECCCKEKLKMKLWRSRHRRQLQRRRSRRHRSKAGRQKSNATPTLHTRSSSSPVHNWRKLSRSSLCCCCRCSRAGIQKEKPTDRTTRRSSATSSIDTRTKGTCLTRNEEFVSQVDDA